MTGQSKCSTLPEKEQKRTAFDPEKKNFGDECNQGKTKFIIGKKFYENTMKGKIHIDNKGMVDIKEKLLIDKGVVKKINNIYKEFKNVVHAFFTSINDADDDVTKIVEGDGEPFMCTQCGHVVIYTGHNIN